MRRDAVPWLLCVAAFALLAVYLASGSGRLDVTHHARGRDFVNLWTAGRLIADGRTLEVFDPATFMAAHHRLFSPRLPFHFWSYPPPALFLAAPFALTPGYFAALAGWSAFGVAVLAWALRVAAPDARDLMLVLACPAVAVNMGLGQNGAVTAALLLGGLALLETRPTLAGALLGLLVFKPQVALLLPVMVLAGGRWRTLWGAAASATALLAASTLVWGVESWTAFLHGAVPMQGAMLRTGRGPFLAMMPSAFASARLLGLDWRAALLVQAPFTALGGWLVWRAWRTPGVAPLHRAAILAAATFVATPQGFNYDLIPAGFAALVLWRAGDRPTDRALALAAWVLPAAMLALGPARLPAAPLVLAALALRLAQLAGATPSRAASRSAAGEAASQT